MEMCCIAECESEAPLVFEGRPYCKVHWQEARDEMVLAEARAKEAKPTPPEWDGAEILRSHGEGMTVDTTTLPTVSESVAEECRRELEEASKNKWRRK